MSNSQNLPDNDFDVSIRQNDDVDVLGAVHLFDCVGAFADFSRWLQIPTRGSQMQRLLRDEFRLPCSCSNGSNELDDEPF